VCVCVWAKLINAHMSSGVGLIFALVCTSHMPGSQPIGLNTFANTRDKQANKQKTTNMAGGKKIKKMKIYVAF